MREDHWLLAILTQRVKWKFLIKDGCPGMTKVWNMKKKKSEMVS